MLICKIDSTQINYEVIDDLINKQLSEVVLDSVIFFLQVLKYLKNVSPRKSKEIVYSSIEYCFKDGEKTRENKIDYIEALFSQLVAFNSIARNKKTTEIAFREFSKNRRIENALLNAFAYEFAIISGDPSLVKYLQDNGFNTDSDYIFILKNYSSLFNSDQYINTLNQFIEKFPIDRLLVTYDRSLIKNFFTVAPSSTG